VAFGRGAVVAAAVAEAAFADVPDAAVELTRTR